MNFYDVLAAEKWDGGIPTINFFDLLFAQSMGGGEQWQVYEGTLPATLNASGANMRQYQIWGNVDGVGDKTVNLFDYKKIDYIHIWGQTGNLEPAGIYTYRASPMIAVTVGKTYLRTYNINPIGNVLFIYDAQKNFISRETPGVGVPFTIPEGVAYIAYNVEVGGDYDPSTYMLTEGSTPPASFVPFGYEVDMAIGSNILQSSEIEWGGWQAAEGTIPSKIVNPTRCRSINVYPISGEKIFYDFKSLNVNIAFVNSNERSLGGTGFKTGVGSVDVPANAAKCLFIIANTDTSTNILPTQVIAAGIWASVDATVTPIYIGSDPLDKDEYVDYQAGKIYRRPNLYDANATDTSKGYLSESYLYGNSIGSSPNWFVSEYIPILAGTDYIISGLVDAGALAVIATINIYNINKQLERYETINSSGNTEINSGVNGAFIRISVRNEHKNTVVVKSKNATPTDPPIALPALQTCEGETIIDYAGQSVAPEKVLLEYAKGGE